MIDIGTNFIFLKCLMICQVYNNLIMSNKIENVIDFRYSCSDAKTKYINDLKEKIALRKLCWETMFGQVIIQSEKI
jgi:hypothetical protein